MLGQKENRHFVIGNGGLSILLYIITRPEGLRSRVVEEEKCSEMIPFKN